MGRIEQAARVLGVTSSLPELTNAVCRLAGRKTPDPGPARELVSTLLQRLDAAEPGVLQTPHDLSDAAEIPQPHMCVPAVPQPLIDAITTIDVRTIRLSPAALAEAALELTVCCRDIDSGIRQAFAERDWENATGSVSLDEPEAWPQPEPADERYFADRIHAELRDARAAGPEALAVLRWAVRVRLAPLGDLLLRLSEWPLQPLAWWCPPAVCRRESPDDTETLVAQAWCRVPEGPQPLQVRITRDALDPDDSMANEPYFPLIPDAITTTPLVPAPRRRYAWSVGWDVDGEFHAYGSQTEPSLAAAHIGAAALIANMLTHPMELRIPLYHHVLIPRTAVKPGNPLAHVIDLHDLLKVMMSTYREERQRGDRPPRWVMRPYQTSDEEHISIVARLLDELCVPWPERTDPANDALPGDEVFLAHLTRHAIVLSPLAKMYLSGLGDAGPDPQSLAHRHTAAMRLILGARTADGAELLSRETPELPEGVGHHHLLDIAWLKRWLVPPNDDGVDLFGS